MLALLLALACTAACAPLLVSRLGRAAFLLMALVPASGFFWIVGLYASGAFTNNGSLVWSTGWMPSAHLNVELRLDSLAALFSMIILGVGTLVLVYCWGYFSKAPHRLSIFAAQLVAFAAAMFGLVTSDNYLLMYTFWEITSILSFLLVGYYGEKAASRRAAVQALMVTVLGGLAMLVGFVLLGHATGTWTFSALSQVDDLAEVPYISAATVLIMAGALTKSAIAPTHFWLPGAMAAPTPVSAYLHSAAMVKAGIYLVARLAPDFHVVPGWHLLVVSLAVFTMLLGGWMALKQKDAKLILAYGTVSQLGFITAIISIGSRETLQAGLVLVFAHALFKAALFMIVGAIDVKLGTRDIRNLSGLGVKAPLLATLAVLSGASMAGAPPLLGFIAKEMALKQVLGEELLIGMPRILLLVGIVLGSVLTVAYTLYFLYGTFATKPASHVSGGGTSKAVAGMKPMGPAVWFSPLVLTAVSLVLGLFPASLDAAITVHMDNVAPLAPGGHDTELALWHGFNTPLALTAVIITAGGIMFWQRKLVQKAQFEAPALGSADHAYDEVVAFFHRISLKITASTQRGSLTINLATIFAVLVALPLISLMVGDRTDVRMILWDSPWQAPVAFVVIIASIAATFAANRLSALVLVGVSGYSMALFFALHGAPDLALTQVLVETIVVVIFMLILRKLPSETDLKVNGTSNRLRAWLAIAVGLSVTVVSLYAVNARSAVPIHTAIPHLAEEIGHGRNAVNVLLVDIRAWDTFGEITVLVIAATGVASLIFRNRSFSRTSTRPVLRARGRRWLAADADEEKAQNRSIMVDVVARLLFPSMVVLSFYFFFAGHNAPGGGFAGGLVAALAIALRYIAGGRSELEATLPVDAGRIMGTGLVLSCASAVVPMFFGHPPLSSYYTSLELPLIGYMSLPSALVFDAGVYLIVIGLVKHILDSMGSELDLEEDMRKQRARDRARSLARTAQKRREAAKAAGKRMPGPESPNQGPLPSAPRSRQSASIDPTSEASISSYHAHTRAHEKES